MREEITTRGVRLLLFLAVLLVLTAAPALATITFTSEAETDPPILTFEPGDQDNPIVVSIPGSSRYYAAWSRQVSAGPPVTYRLEGMRTTDLAPAGWASTVGTPSFAAGYLPQSWVPAVVAMAADGGGAGLYLGLTRIGVDGTPLQLTAPGWAVAPIADAIACQPSLDECLVVWEEFTINPDHSTTHESLRATEFSIGGGAVNYGSTYTLSSGGSEARGKVAFDGANCRGVWQQGSTVRGAFVNPTSGLGTTATIASNGQPGSFATAVVFGEGEYMVVWISLTPGASVSYGERKRNLTSFEHRSASTPPRMATTGCGASVKREGGRG